MKGILGLLAAGVALIGTGLAAQESLDAKQAGRDMTAAFYEGEIGTVWDRFDESMRKAMGGREQLAAFQQQAGSQLGAETGVIDEEVVEQDGYRIYRRTVIYENVPARFVVQWAFDAEGRIAGFFIRQSQQQAPAPTRHEDYRTKAELRLPFEGPWHVFWGGRSPEQNYHVKAMDQRFAYDFLVMRDGSTHAGEGVANEDYHCWGEPVLAPAAGEVVVARDGLADNRPGQMDPKHPPGNYVVIDHGNDEFSFLAHLRQGSVAVTEGERVEPGHHVGLCGNSGNSSEPHLHYHLQDTPEFGAGQGLPAQFRDYRADGEPVARGEPVRGQTVSPGG